MIVASAYNAVYSAISSAIGCAVLTSTGAAGVMRCLAVAGYVAVVLAFGTPEGFLLVLTDGDALVVDAKSVSEYVVSHVCISSMEEGKGFALFL